jgi:uncharacterized membrane protein HdeD (DUF308 family)
MPSLILIILSLMEIASGVLIYHQSFSLFPAVFYFLGYFYLIKGGLSWMGAVAERNLFEWMGTIDVVAGATAFAIAFSYTNFAIPIIGIALALKGLYSLVLSFF